MNFHILIKDFILIIGTYHTCYLYSHNIITFLEYFPLSAVNYRKRYFPIPRIPFAAEYKAVMYTSCYKLSWCYYCDVILCYCDVRYHDIGIWRHNSTICRATFFWWNNSAICQHNCSTVTGNIHDYCPLVDILFKVNSCCKSMSNQISKMCFLMHISWIVPQISNVSQVISDYVFAAMMHTCMVKGQSTTLIKTKHISKWLTASFCEDFIIRSYFVVVMSNT